MQIIPLYRYVREDGGVTVSPIKPDAEYTEMFRLVADEGKELTPDGVAVYSCVDVSSADGWHEVESATNWSTYADQIKPISELEVVDA